MRRSVPLVLLLAPLAAAPGALAQSGRAPTARSGADPALRGNVTASGIDAGEVPSRDGVRAGGNGRFGRRDFVWEDVTTVGGGRNPRARAEEPEPTKADVYWTQLRTMRGAGAGEPFDPGNRVGVLGAPPPASVPGPPLGAAALGALATLAVARRRLR